MHGPPTSLWALYDLATAIRSPDGSALALLNCTLAK